MKLTFHHCHRDYQHSGIQYTSNFVQKRFALSFGFFVHFVICGWFVSAVVDFTLSSTVSEVYKIYLQSFDLSDCHLRTKVTILLWTWINIKSAIRLNWEQISWLVCLPFQVFRLQSTLRRPRLHLQTSVCHTQDSLLHTEVPKHHYFRQRFQFFVAANIRGKYPWTLLHDCTAIAHSCCSLVYIGTRFHMSLPPPPRWRLGKVDSTIFNKSWACQTDIRRLSQLPCNASPCLIADQWRICSTTSRMQNQWLSITSWTVMHFLNFFPLSSKKKFPLLSLRKKARELLSHLWTKPSRRTFPVWFLFSSGGTNYNLGCERSGVVIGSPPFPWLRES